MNNEKGGRKFTMVEVIATMVVIGFLGVVVGNNIAVGVAQGAQAQSVETVAVDGETMYGMNQFPEMSTPDQTLYIFFTTTCPFCEDFYDLVRKHSGFLKEQRVQTMWMPANGRGEEILEAGSFQQLEGFFGRSYGQNDEVSTGNVVAAQNLHDGGDIGVPLLVWEANGEVITNVGTPNPNQFEDAIIYIKTGEKP